VTLAFWPCHSGRNYLLQASPNLASASWNDVSHVWTKNADGWASCLLTNLTANQAFYRLQIQLAP
jgi:hypothetical protein